MAPTDLPNDIAIFGFGAQVSMSKMIPWQCRLPRPSKGVAKVKTQDFALPDSQ